MRKQNLIKRAAMVALAGIMMVASAMPAFATGWQQDDGPSQVGWYHDGVGWKYRLTNDGARYFDLDKLAAAHS